MINSVELARGKTNWFISIVSVVTDFIFGFGASDIYKYNDRLVIQLTNSKIEILLFKVDKEKVEALITRLKQSVGN